MMKLNIQELNEYFAHRGVRETLEYFLNLDLKVGFSTSFGVEDQVITDLINDINPSTYIFSLDTGMLHEETYKTMDETIKKI
jgi:phosphoadenosine phosphosulfate reductase